MCLLQELQSIGVRLTREILSKIAGDFMRMIKKSNKDISKYIFYTYDNAIFAYIYIESPGRHWFENFFKRNSDKLKMKKEVKLERFRRDNFTEEVRSNWFSKLKCILDLNNLHARLRQIWNCDESSFSNKTQCKFSFFLILKFLVLLQANMFAYRLTQSLFSNSKGVLVKHLQRCYCGQVQVVMFSRLWWSMPPKL